MYINDIEINFIKVNCPSVDIQLINIFLLMYADDMAFMVAYFCHHLSDNYVYLSDLYIDLSDLYVDLSLIPSVEK